MCNLHQISVCATTQNRKNEGPRPFCLSHCSLLHGQSTLGHSSINSTSHCNCLQNPLAYPRPTWQHCSEGLCCAIQCLQHVTNSFRKTTGTQSLHFNYTVSTTVYLSDSQCGKHGGNVTPCTKILQLFEHRTVYTCDTSFQLAVQYRNCVGCFFSSPAIH